MGFTGKLSWNYLTFKRPLSYRNALQFAWSFSPTGLNVNGTHKDLLHLQKHIVKDKLQQLSLLGVDSGLPLFRFIQAK